MNRGKKGLIPLFLLFLAAVFPMPAMADTPYGPVVRNPEALGPGVVMTSAYETLRQSTTLLKTDDPVPLFADESLGLGGASVIMLKGTRQAQQLSLIVETSDGKRIVVDGGSGDSTEYLYRYLCENGGTVDAWLITHPHHDHAGALFCILSDPAKYPLNIRRIICNTEVFGFLNAHEDADRRIFTTSFGGVLDAFDQSRLVRNAAAGTVFRVGNAEIRVINTPAQFENNAGNNSSVCYRITVGGKRLLVLGDTGQEAARKLLEEHPAEELKADILQLAHHGQFGGSPELYAAAAPDVALWPSSAEIWNRTRDSFVPPDGSFRPQVTMSWMRSLGVQRNYSMSLGNWVLK